MLKGIIIHEDTNQIDINSEELKSSAEARTHKVGPKTYMEKFIAGKTRLRRQHGWYPEEKKIEVAALFASGVTNATDLARLTGINHNTIRTWRLEDWWTELLERIHTIHDQETVSQLTNIVDKSLEVVQDRLINGEMVIDRNTGEVKRKPVKMTDATKVAVAVVDKRQLLRGKPTSRSEKVGNDERLAKLAEEFRKFSQAKDITPETKQLMKEGHD